MYNKLLSVHPFFFFVDFFFAACFARSEPIYSNRTRSEIASRLYAIEKEKKTRRNKDWTSGTWHTKSDTFAPDLAAATTLLKRPDALARWTRTHILFWLSTTVVWREQRLISHLALVELGRVQCQKRVGLHPAFAFWVAASSLRLRNAWKIASDSAVCCVLCVVQLARTHVVW